jgi:hypothetical protein
MTVRIFCDEYFRLTDILASFLDAEEEGHPVDPKAMERIEAAISKHKRTCTDCK